MLLLFVETEIKSRPNQPDHSRPLALGAALEPSSREGCVGGAPSSAGAQATETWRATGVVSAQALQISEKPRAPVKPQYAGAEPPN